MKYILPLVLVSFLLMGASCATTDTGTTTIECNIPQDYLVKGDKLPQIVLNKDGKISQQQLYVIWLHDIGQYNDLKIKDDKIIDWYAKYCTPVSSTPALSAPAAKPTLFGDQ